MNESVLLTESGLLVPVVTDDLVANDVDLALVLVGSLAGDLARGGLDGAALTNGGHSVVILGECLVESVEV